MGLHGQKSSLVTSVDQPEEDSAVIATVGATRVRNLPEATSLCLATSHPPSSLVRLSRQQATGGTSAATAMSPSELARIGSDLCFFHWS